MWLTARTAILAAAFVFAANDFAMAMDSGDYEGISEGGTLSIVVRGTSVEVGMGSGTSGCGGSGRGTIRKIGKEHWTIALTDGDDICTLDVRKQGADRYNIEESGCVFFHGAACSFDGFVCSNR